MMSEGTGKKAPAPIAVHLSARDIAQLSFVAEQRNKLRSYGQRSDAWGRGFNANSTLLGLFGECATSRLLESKLDARVPLDLALRERGDHGVDLDALGTRLQVKCRERGKDNLIRRVDDRKRIREIDCDAFVFTKWVPPATVHFLGWVEARDVSRVGIFQRSPRADARHFNVVIPAEELEPLTKLVDFIQARRPS